MTDAIALGTKPGVIWWYMLGLIAALYEGVAHEEGWEQELASLGGFGLSRFKKPGGSTDMPSPLD